ncbi:MAG: ligase-associated DNA damage response endonuclease PdeM [Bacteroidota bacterium]|nr:ligase-associated DNA damage response endonuclease PdeM [Bacteroidota bacterium]
MLTPVHFVFHQQTLWLSPARCIFWEEKSALILSDVHFGKSGHFRKSGIGIPQNIFKEDLQRLFSQIQFFKPKILLIAGDMFHSSANREIDFFLKWRNDIPNVEFYLIRGNHDILSKKFYQDANIKVFENKLSIGSFCFTHDISSSCDDQDDKLFTFSGHIHPGIKMKGLGNQSIMLPCFYFGEKYAVLPAFSAFTGLAKIKPLKTDHVFALVENRIIKIQ